MSKNEINNEIKKDNDQGKDNEITCEDVAENTENAYETVDEASNEASNESENEASSNEEIDSLKSQLEEKTKKCEEYFNMLQRTAAEFDNYKKRTVKEKEAIYTDALSDAVASFLPVVDNIERALQAASGDADVKSIREGIELVYRQFKDVMKKLGVEEIKALGEKFDPNLHNAVMHVEDSECGENIVVEEFQKGYKLKDKVIRHSMVKVAN
ncbi:MAG TPA: nucleotide exchange factor GrpE [Acetivibrio sp.]|mgnify:CR=1 FL=1|uniref:nucleotide exchange factor GrpE n=1 Tax=Acetivibrio sp. TaxID=1872092 RepID=UPI002BC7D75F|nr:nucleotide exchange factor GrpE [Acetivibrio sp.]HOM02462.1 nucleotide exchange factor GrpE [Acetivibrio sp.]